MTTLLEQRYRTVLRLLPASYRAEREEEMVETYLLGVPEAEQELMRPALGETASVAALALRLRLGAAGATAGQARFGATVRLGALLAVLLQAAWALTERAMALAWAHSSPRYGALLVDEFTGQGLWTGARRAAEWGLPVLWVAVFAALLAGRRRTARVCAVLAAVPSLFPLGDVIGGGPTAGLPLALAAFAWLTAIAVLCGHHSDAPPARLPVLPPGQALLGTCVLMGGSIALPRIPVDSEWALGTAYLAAVAGWAVLRLRRHADAARPEAALALAALGLPVLALRLLMLQLLLDTHLTGAIVVGAAVQAAAIVVAVAATALAGARALAASGEPSPRPERASADR